jgi:hypothetical protein
LLHLIIGYLGGETPPFITFSSRVDVDKSHVTGYAARGIVMSIFYATFQNAIDAERAAGALIDHGVGPNDLTITSKPISEVHSNQPTYEDSVQSAENEGWPVRSNSVIASELRKIDQSDTEAGERYLEADKAERSAKFGISITTLGDAIVGALRGGFIGAFVGIVIAFYTATHYPVPMGHFVLDGAIGLAIGTAVGAGVGMLTDQGAEVQVGRTYKGKGGARPVLLVVDTSSVHFADGEAQRLISKYRASSIDESR